MRQRYAIIDFETTGLNRNGEDQVIEIAALKTDFNGFTDEFHTMVSLEEGKVLSDFVKNLTGITEADLAGRVPEHVAMTGLWDFIYTNANGQEPIVVAHHAPFDFSFMKKYNMYPREFICTRVLSKLVEPKENASLAKVAQRLGVPLEGHHRALNDVYATADVLQKLMAEADRRGIPYQNIIINDVERPLDFTPAYATVYSK